MADNKLAEELAEHLAECDGRRSLFTDDLDAIERAYRDEYRRTARVALDWLAERGRLVPDGPGEVVEGCGCPITYEVAKIENHTYECGQRQAAERMARYIDEEYGDG